MIRLGLVGPLPADPNRAAGGVEAVLGVLAVALHRHPDIELTVVATNAADDRDYPFPVLDAGRPSTTGFGQLTDPARVRRRLHGLDLDLTHVHAHAWSGALVPRAPVAFTAHGFPAEDSQRRGNGPIRVQLVRVLNGLGDRRYHAHLCLSPLTEARATRRSATVNYIDNPVPATLALDVHAPEPGRVLVAGALSEAKGQLQFVRSLGRLPRQGNDLRVRLAGPVRDAEIAAEIKRVSGRSGLKVDILGALDHADLRAEYRLAAVLAVPSEQEHVPVVVSEARTIGVPVESLDVGAVGHLLPPDAQLHDDHDGLAVAVAAAAARPRTTDRTERFLPDTVVGRTIDVYRLILGGEHA